MLPKRLIGWRRMLRGLPQLSVSLTRILLHWMLRRRLVVWVRGLLLQLRGMLTLVRPRPRRLIGWVSRVLEGRRRRWLYRF